MLDDVAEEVRPAGLPPASVSPAGQDPEHLHHADIVKLQAEVQTLRELSNQAEQVVDENAELRALLELDEPWAAMVLGKLGTMLE